MEPQKTCFPDGETENFANTILTSSNYDNLLDKKVDDIEFMLTECDLACNELREEILREYEKIKPVLSLISLMKQTRSKIKEKRELLQNFLIIADLPVENEIVEPVIIRRKKTVRSRSAGIKRCDTSTKIVRRNFKQKM